MPTLTLDLPDGHAEAYLAAAPDGRPAPGVLFIVDAIGLRPQIERMADRIASWGYSVLAPHVFFREGAAADLAPDGDLGDPEARRAFMAEAMPRVHRLTPDVLARTSLRTSRPCVRAPRSRGRRSGSPATAWAPGSRYGRPGSTPASSRSAAGTGAGSSPMPPTARTWTLATARAAFAFGHADHDGSMPPKAVTALGEALDAAGLQSVNEVFPGPHGYSMADTAMYDEESAERHFDSLRALLDRTLER